MTATHLWPIAAGGGYIDSENLGQLRDSVDVLLKNGSDPNARNNEGETPLHHAVATIFDKSELVDALLVARSRPKRSHYAWIDSAPPGR